MAKVKPKMRWVTVTPSGGIIQPIVHYERSRRRLPNGEPVEIPLTAYYLRKIHNGELTPCEPPSDSEESK